MLLLAVLLTVFTASAETLNWVYPVYTSAPYQNGSVSVFPDGTGGCVVFAALSIPGNANAKLGRTIWLNHLGQVIFTNYFEVTNGQAFVQRVTKSDLYVGGTEFFQDSGTYSNFTIRVQRKGGTARIVPTQITMRNCGSRTGT